MHMIPSLFALGSLAAVATALSKADFEFPETVPLEKRQTEGPAFECHNNCGLAIQGAREEGYCENDEWLNYLDGCLDCALEFDIWRYYGRLESLAEPCGIDATPRPADGGDDDSSSAAVTAEPTTAAEAPTSAAAEPTTDGEASSPAAEPTTAEESSAAAAPTTLSSVGTSSSAAATGGESSATDAPGSSSSEASSTPTGPSVVIPVTPTPTPTSEGSQMLRSGFLAAGVAIMLAVNLM